MTFLFFLRSSYSCTTFLLLSLHRSNIPQRPEAFRNMSFNRDGQKSKQANKQKGACTLENYINFNGGTTTPVMYEWSSSGCLDFSHFFTAVETH